MKEVALPTTKPIATARPILSPSNTWTTNVSWIRASGLIPDLEFSVKTRGEYTRRDKDQISFRERFEISRQ